MNATDEEWQAFIEQMKIDRDKGAYGVSSANSLGDS